MQIIDADPTRMIDLPGVGPCPRPVDIDQGVTGFTVLKSLRIYRFRPGAVIEGESEIDEVFVLPVAGEIALAIRGAHGLEATLSPDGPARAAYMTPDHAYRLTPRSEALVAYARAAASGCVASQAMDGAQSEGLAEHLAYAWHEVAAGDEIRLAGERETLCYLAEGTAVADGARVQAGQTLALKRGQAARVAAETRLRLLVVRA